MRSKPWSRKSAPACAAISLLAIAPAALWPQSPPPAIAIVDAADAPQWETWAKGAGFHLILSTAPAGTLDGRVQSLSAAVAQAVETRAADPERIYLAGRGTAAAGVFYALSRLPDLWAGAVAIEGSPQPAIDSDRLFAANFSNAPVLWVTGSPDAAAMAARLTTAGIALEVRPPAGFSDGALVGWLREHRRDAFPMKVDCETNSPNFASCFWIRMLAFDPAERNDVLPSSRLLPGSGAALDLGAFQYAASDPGPGILVSALADKYKGPLKANDRLIALDGRPIENPRQLLEMLSKYAEEKPAVVTVQRGKDRVRVETRVMVPRREPLVTARVQGQYLPDEKVIQIASRTVKQMRVTVPAAWADATLYWNGLVLEKAAPGCLLLSIENGLLNAAKCP
jgi:dienelactone hydrolase